MSFRSLSLVALGLLTVSCISHSVDLEEVGKKVTVKKGTSNERPEGFERVKFISCDEGANGRSAASNQAACENYLRNEAGRVGAELVIVEKKDEGESWAFGKTCNNCQVSAGWAYRKKKEKDKDAEAKQPVKEELADVANDDEEEDREPVVLKKKKLSPEDEPFQMGVGGVTTPGAPSGPGVPAMKSPRRPSSDHDRDAAKNPSDRSDKRIKRTRKPAESKPKTPKEKQPTEKPAEPTKDVPKDTPKDAPKDVPKDAAKPQSPAKGK